MTIHLVPDCNLETLLAGIDRLNKRCKRLGLRAIEVSHTPDHVKARVEVPTAFGEVGESIWMLPAKIAEANAKWPHRDTGDRMVWHAVTVTGESPSLNGWAFIAILEPMKTDDGSVLNFASVLPGEECPAEQRSKVNVCDHCHATRRRSQTFILKHEDGTYKSVGRQCLKDFLGYHADPAALVAGAENLASLAGLLDAAGEIDEDDYDRGGHREKTWDLTRFLETTACRIRVAGFLGAGKAYEQGRSQDSTKAKVIALLTPPAKMYMTERQIREEEAFQAMHTVTDADTALAEEAITWARDLPAVELESSDYLANVNLVCRIGAVTSKTAGVAASVITAYEKAVGRAREQQVKAALPESSHVGTIGKRVKGVVVTCERVILNEGAFGVTGIHKIRDVNGNDLVWFASKGKVLDEGQTYTVAMTPKEHGEFRGRKQTVVSRLEVAK